MNILEVSQNLSIQTLRVPFTPYITDQITLICKWVIIASACQILDVFGIVTNIINIICFLKQGFKEPINVSLLGLAVSDFCSLITLDVVNSLYTLSISAHDVSFNPLEVAYLVGALPHFAFTRVSTWITVMITLERCLCVLAPLKVKTVVTVGRVKIVTVWLFILLISTESPMYFVNKLGMVFSVARNMTILGLITSENREIVQSIIFTFNNFNLPFVASTVIIICTVVLVVNLQQRADWRKTSTTTETISIRNQKLGKMVAIISALFICCQIPCAISMLALALEPGLNMGGRYVNIGTIIFGIGLLAESINSSTNIFIYYHMSSKYRETFQKLFLKYFTKN